MPAKMRQSPYWPHIQHWDVPKGKIGKKDRNGKLKVVWQRDEIGDLYIVCPHCFKIQHVPSHLLSSDKEGDITCMFCRLCNVDYSYTLKGFGEPDV